MMKCWKCYSELVPSPNGKIAIRATCDKCHAWLHCCKNCSNYQPGLPNDCKIPGTEQIADREACNFCDEFSLREVTEKKLGDADEVSKKLFGNEHINPKTKSFDDLFND